ncbi:hypothetical protein PSP6_540048 [Paraburkholderia tropica]|uniref:hypothetical protein n=1 Tax=Paraburkholderia tropica TaxID=92647 RepID=UPI001CAE7E1E|nr:hypothetical protein [Paraburkholderia tropica]CAG9230076.1 hypothetical protein PSP6_540048 [Paraburkholderia tropica]
MSSDEKRPTLIRFMVETYQRLLKAAGLETERRGHQVTVPKLVEEIVEPIVSIYPKLHKAAMAESERRGENVSAPALIGEILDEWLKKHNGKVK